jgi:hypothetical protein
VTDPTQPTEPVAASPRPAASDLYGASPATGHPFGGQPAPVPTPVAPVAVRRRSSTSTVINVLLGIAVVVAVGGVAFAAGRATAPTTVAATGGNGFRNGQFPGGGPNASGAPGRGGFVGGFGGGGGGISLQGTVTAASSESITLQLASGQTVTIPLDASTTYHSRSAATSSDVANGATVIVQLDGRANGQGGAQNPGQGPTGSGGPGRAFGSASSITIVPPGS